MVNSTAIKEYMSTSIATITEDMDIIAASKLLVKHGISGAPVVDTQGKLIGILTERDCFKVTLDAEYYEEPGGNVRNYMSKDVKTVTPDVSIFELAELFIKEKYRRYPVIAKDKLIGMISRRDILKALLNINLKR